MTLAHHDRIRGAKTLIAYDMAEQWSYDSNVGAHFQEVTLHEIGHALGLDHSK